MFKQGDKVTIEDKQGVWLVKDADERFNNDMMLVHLQADSGFVLLAVRGCKCNLINEGGK
jgi:hypothetical protein